MVLPRWLLCGYLSAMPAPVALRVWDVSILAASRAGGGRDAERDGALGSVWAGSRVCEGDESGGAGIRVLLQTAVGLLRHREAAILRAAKLALTGTDDDAGTSIGTSIGRCGSGESSAERCAGADAKDQ